MKRHICLLAFALMALSPYVSQAQMAQRITFDDAIRLALDNNSSLKRAANTVRQQEINLSAGRAAILPSLNFSSGTSRNFGLNFDQTTGNVYTQSSDRFNLGASMGVTLFNGFREFSGLRQLRHGLAASDDSFERQRQLVVFQVMTQYLGLIQWSEQIKIQGENLAAQQQQLAQIEEFVRVGSRPMSDLYQQQYVTENAELLLLEAQQSYQVSEGNLIQTLQLDPFGVYEFVVPDESEITLTPEAYDINALLRSAFDRRVDLRAQESMIRASEQGLRFARGGMWPRVSLSGSAGSGYSSFQQRAVIENGVPVLGPDGRPMFEEVPFGDQLSNNRSQTVSLSVQVPLFNGLRTRSDVQRARVNLDNARLELENVQHQIGLEVRESYLAYLSDEKRLAVTEKQLQSAELALEAEQERYNVGASTLVELTQARAAFVQAASNRADAKFSFIFRKRLIDYYVGVLDPGAPLFE